MLASRQKTHSKKKRPASKILLLPGISRALVLSLSTASIFTLPEFAPLSGIGSLRDVNDISKDIDDRSSNDENQEEAVVTAFTKTAIRIVRVQQSSLKLLTNIQYPGASVGLQRSNFALVANATQYDLIDLQNNQQIPLFPISTASEDDSEIKVNEDKKEDKKEESTDSEPTQDNEHNEPPVSKDIKPLIAPVGSDEFLVLSGSKVDEPAMGLVVNKEGNISRGTIAWPEYPSSVAVEYPYVASVIGKQVQFHSLHDQSLIQAIDYESVPLVNNVSSAISQSYHPLAEKIRLVALEQKEGVDDTDRIEKERKIAEALSVISSSLFVYSREKGIECLLSSPRIFQLEKLVENEKIDEVLEEMGTLEITTERGVVELEYLNLLVGMGYLLHKDFSGATTTWLEGSLDPRLVVHIYDKESVTGELWIFNGILQLLNKIVDKYSENILVEKSTGLIVTSTKKKDTKKAKSIVAKDQKESLQFYHYFLQQWLTRRDLESVTDKQNVFKTIEKATLKLLLRLDAETAIKKVELYTFISEEIIESWDETIETLKSQGKHYGLFLLYKKRGDITKVCDIWKDILTGEISDHDFKGTEEEFASYLCEHVSGQQLWDYGMWLVNRNPHVGLKIFTNRPEFKDDELMEAFKKLENQDAWRDYLRILVYDKKNYSFHGELVIVSVEDLLAEITNNKKGQDLVIKSYETYRSMGLPKRSYYEYMTSLAARGTSANSKGFKKIVQMRQDLLKLLTQENGQYDADLVNIKLNDIDYDAKALLNLELSVVYNCMGLHERAIHILCHDLHDFEQSIKYCQYGEVLFDSTEEVVKQTEVQQQLFFGLLYDEYLQLEPETVQAECTRQLLESHGRFLDMKVVLSKTPASWPLERLSGYLLHVLRHIMKEKNESILRRSLARAENVKTSNVLQELNELKLQIEEDK